MALLIVFVLGGLAVLFAAFLAWDVLKRDTGNDAMRNRQHDL
jgi:Na+/H+-translocating membrane pyrophosphatase